jgi:predicted nucleotidyltransferase
VSPISPPLLSCGAPYPGQIASKLPGRRPESAYLDEVTLRLEDSLGVALVGVYVGGSWALGDYRPGRSDLDVAAVVRADLPPGAPERIVARLRHEALPCPAAKLELVTYRLATARSPTPDRRFELNLNTGERDTVRVDPPGSGIADHWFPIDRSILAQAGRRLRGPPAPQVFARIPPGALAPILAESVRWHRDHAAAAGDSVLNACRALRFAAEGRWCSKSAARRWAVERRLAASELVRRSDLAMNGETSVDPVRVARFLETVESRLRHDKMILT